MDVDAKQLRYLQLLAKQYPSIRATSTAIINLTAELNLPKGTEHFISDIHGEYEAFRHVLKNASGSIRRKIEEIFGESLSAEDKRNLATLIYYPEEKLPLILRREADKAAWYRQTLLRLLKVCRVVSAKYTRAGVEQFLPTDFAATIEELLFHQANVAEKTEYYETILETIIETDSARAFIVALAELIQQLAIARLHIVGDIFDRGPGAHLIMDALMAYHTVDILWGNHDILWMGAAAGSDACLASVIRLSLRYANMETLDNGYAINLLPLASFAIETYGQDPCRPFMPKLLNDSEFTEQEIRLMAQMHKAIAIIQFKLEGQIIKRRPHYQMEERLLLDKIDLAASTVTIDGTRYPLLDGHFPTLDPNQPYELTTQERAVIEKLRLSFTNSKRLQQHVRYLYSKGSMYLVHNGNLLYHGCIALNEDGSFKAFKVDGQEFAGKVFLDRVDRLARQGYFATDDPERKLYGMDAMWYLWSGEQSPLFGKERMTTFEKYFVADETTHHEPRNPYYKLRHNEATARQILVEFGADPDRGHIINGHVPVQVRKGESPIKANGKLLVIDGGFSKAYQKQTGIAGYTLVYNSYGLLLAAHHPLESAQKAIQDELDIDSETEILESNTTRLRVKDTDRGREIQKELDDLHLLLRAYRTGLIKEA
ncbi:MAG: fructose-1,6-bisphosphatase [Anaerolineae bacterium]|nr:fructose-1,6-bisphosphatase [Anaerolineae bacterium]